MTTLASSVSQTTSWRRIKDPFPALSHWAGAALSCPPDVRAPHTVFGTMGRDDYAVRNTHEVVHHLWDVTPR